MAVENLGLSGQPIIPPRQVPGGAAGEAGRASAKTEAAARGPSASSAGVAQGAKADRLTTSVSGPAAIRGERVAQAGERIATGFYDQPRVREELAARLLTSLGLDRED